MKKAFSVAEAMIALLIGSLILGASAPMISKQLKHNNMSDAQVQVLNRKIEQLGVTQSNIPSGAVMYFDLDFCPDGWDELINKYPNSANAFIRNKSGTARTLGNWQQNAAPNITGKMEKFLGGSIIDYWGKKNAYNLKLSGAFTNNYLETSLYFDASNPHGYLEYMDIYFDASEGGSTVYGRDNATEVRPDNIALLACIKD